MKILITGNMGYVGPSVVKQLRQSYPDGTLLGVDAGFFAHCLTAVPCLPECRVDTQHFVDVRNVSDEILRNVDAVVHLAAVSNDPMGNVFEEVTLEINHQASVALAKKAKEVGVKRFVFASSCSVYGFAEGGARNEQAELNPLTAYAKSKVNTEKDLQRLAGDDFVVSCLRFATACGMSDRLRLDLVLNDFVAGAISSKEISILSDGTPWRPLIHVDDMALAIDWAVGRGLSTGGDFVAINAGCDEWNYQVKDLAEAVAKIIPGTKVSINEDAQPDKRSYQVDFELFRSLAPDHQPKVDLERAIVGLRDGLQSMGFSDNEFRSSGLMRLKTLTSHLESGLLDSKLRWKF